MPSAIDEAKFTDPTQQLQQLDINKPPVINIPFLEFPKMVYKHPRRTYREIPEKDLAGNVVAVRSEATEHKTLIVKDEEELRQAMEQGWVTKPYIAQAPPDSLDNVYDDIPQPPKQKASNK